MITNNSENNELNPKKQIDYMQTIFEQQKKYVEINPYPTIIERQIKLKRLAGLLRQDKELLCDALNKDYGHRSRYDSLLSEIMVTILHIEYTLKHLKKWMRPSFRRIELATFPALTKVIYQPVGIIGIITPWNFPINVSLIPLVTAIAAGNSVMVKMSELTPHTNLALTKLMSKVFTKQQVAIVEGEAVASAYFSSLPFNHLLFTGSTKVGIAVMKAAAEQLTPVTLELGGKSPVIIAPDCNISFAVERIIFGKSLNAGQICVAPDYVLLPQEKIPAFIECYLEKFKQLYPKGLDSDDWTSVINDAHYKRLQRYLEEAKLLGATIIPCVGHSDHSNVNKQTEDIDHHRMTTHLVTDIKLDDELAILNEEIFGPILLILGYDHIEQALTYIKSKDRPLALYLMSHDAQLQQRVSYEIHSGTLCFNETVMQTSLNDAPFGGIGASGIGQYRGAEGFYRFSHSKTLLHKGKFSFNSILQPPYGSKWQNRLLALILGK